MLQVMVRSMAKLYNIFKLNGDNLIMCLHLWIQLWIHWLAEADRPARLCHNLQVWNILPNNKYRWSQLTVETSIDRLTVPPTLTIHVWMWDTLWIPDKKELRWEWHSSILEYIATSTLQASICHGVVRCPYKWSVILSSLFPKVKYHYI